MQEMLIWSLGREDPLEKEMATHPSILAWEIPWTEEHGRLHSWGCRVRHSWRHPHHHTSIFQDKWQEEHSPLFNFLVLDYYLEKLMAWRYPRTIFVWDLIWKGLFFLSFEPFPNHHICNTPSRAGTPWSTCFAVRLRGAPAGGCGPAAERHAPTLDRLHLQSSA